MLSTGLSLIKSAYSRGLAYVRDGLKLYMPYRGSDHSEVKFVGTGSTNFDGTNDYVSVADAANLSFGDGSDDSAFSISAWIKMDDTASFEIIGKGEYNVDAEWRFRTESDSKLHFTLYDEDVSSTFENAYTDVALTAYEGKWVHVVGTYNGIGGEDVAKTGITLYVNGVVAASTQTSGGTYVSMVNGTSPVEIGLYAASVYAEGNMKNIAIWSRELTATEVQNVMYKTYDEVGGRLASGLVSWWALDATGLGEERINDPDFLLTGTKLTGNYETPQGVYWETEWDISYAAHATTDADNGWAISGGAATLNDSHTTGFDLVNSTGGANDNSTVFVTSYQVTFEVTDVNGGAVAPMIGGTIGTTRSTVGTYTETIITANTDAFRMRSVGAWSGSITVKNISAKLVAAVDLKSSNDGTILGPIVDTDLYGGDTPVKPRAIDNAPTVQADAIGAGSALFNGSSDYIAIDGIAGNIVDQMAFTVTAWFKGDGTTESGAADSIIFGANTAAGAANVLRIGLDGVASDEGIFYSDPGTGDITITSTDYNDKIWHHLAVTRAGGDGGQLLTIYVDGISVGTNSGSDFEGATIALVAIGGEYDGSTTIGDFWSGNICQVGVWSAALTQAQIQSIMEKTFDELTSSEKTNLVSYWPLDEVVGDIQSGSYEAVLDKVDETLGSEIVSDGGFDVDASIGATGSYWALGAGWTITGGIATHSGGVNNNFNSSPQSLTLDDGAVYRLSFTVAGTGTPQVGVFLGSDTSISSIGAGTWTFYHAAGTSDENLSFRRTSGEPTVDNVSLKKVGGNPGRLT